MKGGHDHGGWFCKACQEEGKDMPAREETYQRLVKLLNDSTDRVLRGKVVDFDVPKEKKVNQSFVYRATFNNGMGSYDIYVVALSISSALQKLAELKENRVPSSIAWLGEVVL